MLESAPPKTLTLHLKISRDDYRNILAACKARNEDPTELYTVTPEEWLAEALVVRVRKLRKSI